MFLDANTKRPDTNDNYLQVRSCHITSHDGSKFRGWKSSNEKRMKGGGGSRTRIYVTSHFCFFWMSLSAYFQQLKFNVTEQVLSVISFWSTIMDVTLQFIISILFFTMSCNAFIPFLENCATWNHRLFVLLNDDETNIQVSSYDKSDASSKGLVSVLTNVINSLAGTKNTKASVTLRPSPSTPNELMERIREDYVKKNYLWTGDIDIDRKSVV